MPDMDARDMDATVPLDATVTVPPAEPPEPPAPAVPASTRGMRPIAVAAIVVGAVIALTGTFAGGIATGVVLDGFGHRVELNHVMRQQNERFLPRAPRQQGQQGKQGQRQQPQRSPAPQQRQP